MGREIARNNCPDEPGKHSRLWLSKDIRDVLKNHKVILIYVSIRSLAKLVSLDLTSCEGLTSFPDTICRLKALTVLSIDYCISLKALPVNFGNIKSLKVLNSKGLAVSKLPASIGLLSNLVELRLSDNKNLKTLPGTMSNLRLLEVLDIEYCSSLEALPAELGNIESLKELLGQGIAVSELPDSIGRLSKLVELRLIGNKNLKTLPDTICNLRSLEIINISGCKRLETLPNQMWKITRLRDLVASSITMLQRLPDIEYSEIALSMKKLDLSKNIFTSLPSSISQLSNLEDLHLGGCGHLLSIAELPSSLRHLTAHYCKSMKRLPNLSNLKRLEILNLANCRCLKEIQGLEGLSSIKFLDLG